jgi:CDP-paratose 2-epimerase
MGAARALVTGSCGLIGSEVSQHFYESGYSVLGIDNNQRAVFFGPQGDTRWNQHRLERELPSFVHHELDIRDRPGVLDLLKEIRPAVIVHAAAQPSHDWAAQAPAEDFAINATATLSLLERVRPPARAPWLGARALLDHGDTLFTHLNSVAGSHAFGLR